MGREREEALTRIKQREDADMRKVTVTYSTPIDALIDVARRMGGYENRYDMKSERFIGKYQAGEMPCENDFMDWATACRDLRYLRNAVEDRVKDVA